MIENTTPLLCIQTSFMVTLVFVFIGCILLYWLTHTIEKKQTEIEDKLLARTIARKLYETLKEEKSI